jgi:hypothetical protein
MRRFKSVKQSRGFWVFMQLSATYSILVVTWWERNTIEILGQVRLHNGVGR